MPGRHLNDVERNLQNRWRRSSGYPFPTLRAIRVGGAGIRGIQTLDLEFRYPVTVICGRNGTGKSTLLALAALAFHASPGHVPKGAMRKPKSGEKSSYYTFGDFFFRGPGDAAASGVRWTWTYDTTGTSSEIAVTRSSDKKWMSYERRPGRPVDFVGIARTVPAIERRVLRHHFPIASTAETSIALDASFRPNLESVMGRPYAEASVMRTRGHALRRVVTSVEYSSFNMGAGEDLLVDLLYTLQSAPTGALVVIEEIELGLHPAAVAKLAQVIQQIALAKSLQVIVSSHSFEFLDQLPRQARVLLQTAGNDHVVTYEPSARYALGDMSGHWAAELIVGCEDDFAASIIRLAMSGDAAKRSRVAAVGSDSSLTQFARFHRIAGNPERLLLVWDGDVDDAKIVEWAGVLEDDTQANWAKLPGNEPPERWLHRHMQNPSAPAILGTRFNEPTEVIRRAIDACGVVPDPHSILFELSRALSRTTDEVSAAVLDVLVQVAATDLERIRDLVDSVLAGGRVREPELPAVAP